jgi:hypothetical protein
LIFLFWIKTSMILIIKWNCWTRTYELCWRLTLYFPSGWFVFFFIQLKEMTAKHEHFFFLRVFLKNSIYVYKYLILLYSILFFSFCLYSKRNNRGSKTKNCHDTSITWSISVKRKRKELKRNATSEGKKQHKKSREKV